MTYALRREWSGDLDTAALYRLLALRVEVFVVEQRCPYPELDGLDLRADTRHFWLQGGDGGVVATLRLLEQFHDDGRIYRIGRVCTRRDERGRGHTGRLLRAALAEVGTSPCRLDAQSHLESLYAGFGFVRDGAEFREDGIAHVPMLRPARRVDADVR